MSCILKFRSLKISLKTSERSFHRREKTEISREASWDIYEIPPFGPSMGVARSGLWAPDSTHPTSSERSVLLLLEHFILFHSNLLSSFRFPFSSSWNLSFLDLGHRYVKYYSVLLKLGIFLCHLSAQSKLSSLQIQVTQLTHC